MQQFEKHNLVITAPDARYDSRSSRARIECADGGIENLFFMKDVRYEIFSLYHPFYTESKEKGVRVRRLYVLRALDCIAASERSFKHPTAVVGNLHRQHGRRLVLFRSTVERSARRRLPLRRSVDRPRMRSVVRRRQALQRSRDVLLLQQ